MILVPIGGLCNRLRAILSAVDAGMTPSIEWSVNADCGARWDELFLPPVINGHQLLIKPCPWWNRPTLWRLRLNRLLPLPTVFTGNELQPYDTALVQQLSPIPELQQQIDRLSQDFDAHTVGIHIRRTDHAIARQHSTDEDFRKALRQMIADDPEVRFYLATDDEALKQAFVSEFAPRMTAQHCTGHRADRQGMREAVIDLWTLARTSRILGSYWSSFSGTAAEIGGIPYNDCTSSSHTHA